MESTLKTPSKLSVTQHLPSSGSSSPFTPKRSRIKSKNSEEFSTVSRVLAFDDSHIPSPNNGNPEFSPLSQPKLIPYENELEKTQVMYQRKPPVNSQQTTPVKNELMTPVKSEQSTPVKSQNLSILEKPKVLLSPSIQNRLNRFNVPDCDKNFAKPSPRKRGGSNNSTPSKKLKPNSIQNCKQITEYFKPTQKRSDSVQPQKNEKNRNPKTENSPFVTTNICQEELKNISKSEVSNEFQSYKISYSKTQKNNSPRKKVAKNINKKVPVSPLSDEKKKKANMEDLQVTPTKNENIKDNVNNVKNSPKFFDLRSYKCNVSGGGDTYSRFIRKIVMNPEVQCLGKHDILEKLTNCTDDELKIYGRLFSRKHGWIRFNVPNGLNKYKEMNLCKDFDSVLMSLETKQLIKTDVTSELDSLLNILKSQELKELQKVFKLKSKTKPAMIKSFINLVKEQKSFFGNSLMSNLKKRVNDIVGYCLKLSEEPTDDVMSCLILDSYPHFSGDEKDRFRECFTKFSLVEKNVLKFPTFEINRISVNFNSADDLEMYKNALNSRLKVQLFCEQKDHESAINVLKTVFKIFKSAVCDEHIVSSLLKIPTYMRKYSAVSVYAHTLFKNILALKEWTSDEDLIKDVLEFLLKHKEFLISKKAELHIELAKVYESQYKNTELAAKTILDGLKDATMSELNRQMLSSRAVMYANRKIRKLDAELKKELLNVITIDQKQLPSITISGNIVSIGTNNSSGRKQVYSKQNENGDILYMSVEELALSHYKSQGYFNGLHDEGQLIKSMFLLCFWDIIYGSYPPHILFISQYQDCPLDWRSRHFYNIREKEIRDRLEELKQMDVNQIFEELKTLRDKYCDTESVINWKFISIKNLPLCKTLLECVGIGVFLAIGNQILKDGRVYLHGLPDLIVWDDDCHKCLFVEVKGPKDKLSERQTSWLYKLMEFGANVEVCHVVGTGGKSNDCENFD